jgi:CubicO group peptidase (beta-lactamase class C family)
MTVETYADSQETKLSTDRYKTSSASHPFFALAYCALFALASSRIAASQQDPHPIGQTVGKRLAADLTWTQAERDERFAHMDRLFPVHTVKRGGKVRPLPRGPLLAMDGEITRYMQVEHLAGVLVLQHGHIRAERYALGLTPSIRWTSFSVTKAVTDTLAGAALHRGDLRSLEDDVTRYLPEMRGSAYDGVTVRQLITMTSGVRWNENYTSTDADNVRLYTTPVAPGHNSTVEYMRRLPRAATPGSRWLYNTGETDLLGVLLHRATGKPLSQQLSQAIWQHAGMEQSATWIASASGKDGEEFGGSGLSATLRDFGRLGQWVLEGGGGTVDPGWFADATRAQVQAGNAEYGYGWWPQAATAAGDKARSFAALGIFGQSILIDPQRQLVVVTLGDWDTATGKAHTAARAAFWQQVKAAVDQDQPPSPSD